MNYYYNKTVIITGAANGLGRSQAMALHARSAQLILLDKVKVALDSLQNILKTKHSKHMFIEVDISINDQLKSLKPRIERHFDYIDMLINNADVSHSGRIQETTFLSDTR